MSLAYKRGVYKLRQMVESENGKNAVDNAVKIPDRVISEGWGVNLDNYVDISERTHVTFIFAVC